MKRFIKFAGLLVAGFLMSAAAASKAGAQALPARPAITFDSFTATYNLSRDANGHSLLTTEEVIKADFPDNGNFTGIKRAIPKSYQGHTVAVKVMTVQDAAGRDVPYKTSKDNVGNLVLTTGDPQIAVYGFQTYHIKYQTQDVVDLNSSQDQFLLDVNGRGWDQPFGSVAAVLYLPKTVASDLTAKPACYIGYLNTTSPDCTATSRNLSNQIVVTAKSSGQVGSQHGLVVKLSFKPAAFSHNPSQLNAGWIIAAVIAALAALASVYWYSRRA